MNARVVAVNRNLGVVVVQTDTHNCVVLDVDATQTFVIGEDVAGDWDQPGAIVVHNLTNGDKLSARVQKVNATRSEAVGGMSFV